MDGHPATEKLSAALLANSRQSLQDFEPKTYKRPKPSTSHETQSDSNLWSKQSNPRTLLSINSDKERKLRKSDRTLNPADLEVYQDNQPIDFE